MSETTDTDHNDAADLTWVPPSFKLDPDQPFVWNPDGTVSRRQTDENDSGNNDNTVGI